MIKKGFTLVEILIVLTIIAVLGLVIVNTLIQTLRGQKKVQVVSQTKQNGQVVLDRIVQEVRSAEYLVCVKGVSSLDWDSLVLFRQGTFIRFRFYPATASHNGFIALDYPTYSNLPTPPPPTPTISPALFGSDLCNEAQLFNSGLSYLSDTDLVSGVSVSYDPAAQSPTGQNRIFILNHSPGYSDNVTIDFKLNAGIQAGQGFENTVGSSGIIYKTTVLVRGR